MPGAREIEDERGLQVLIVDDHAMVRQGIRSILEGEGYRDIQIVGEAGNGIEAITLVEQLHPHIILMDINMPRMNGIDATAHIKTEYPDTRIIGLSVNASTEDQVTRQQAGAVRLIQKAEVADLLYDAMHDAVTSRDTSGPTLNASVKPMAEKE